MLYKGLLVTMLSGSMDGITASHNRGGSYLRSRVVPVDPMSEQQLLMRAAMSDVSTAWRDMNASQRSAWNTYAASITTTNRIGDRRTLTGRQAWSQFALPQYQQVEALDHGRAVSVTPPAYPTDDFNESPVVTLPALDTLRIAWLSPTTWEASGSPNDGMIIHIGRAHSQQVNWYRGPYIPYAWIESDEDTPPTSPQDVTLADADQPTAGQVLDGFIRLFREDRPNGRRWPFRCIAPG